MTKLIPFDLEAAKRGEPVITRDGRRARIVCWDGESASGGNRFPLIALIGEGSGQMAGLFDVSGACINNDHRAQLFMVPKPKRKVIVPECWVHKVKVYAVFNKPDLWSGFWHHVPAHEVEIDG